MAKTKEERREDRELAALQLGGTAFIGQQTIRSGIPRAFGVRLESHSTGRKKAKSILRDGFLDPKKSGGGATSSFDGFEGLLDSRKELSKGKVFITGSHPSKNANPLYDRTMAKNLRKNYRATGNLTSDDWRRSGAFNVGIQQAISGDPERLVNSLKDKKTRRLLGKNFLNTLPFVDNIQGRSLYVGGSDKYFRNNFQVDPDIPFAMMSDKKVPMSGNRLSATRQVVRREGLGKLVKANPRRVAAGLAILGAGGYVATKAAKAGIKNLKESTFDGKVKGHTRRTKSGVSRVRGHRRDV